MIIRMWNGQLVYKKDKFFVGNHKNRNMPFEILVNCGDCCTDTYFADCPFGTGTPVFDSFIKACIWLKEHHTELL